jgi:hypothetical protein
MQPTPPGWYWDPGNRPGLFRWWDGHAWTDVLSASRTREAPAPLDLPKPGPDGRFSAGGLSLPALPDPWHPCPPYPAQLETAAGQELVVGRTPRGPYLAVAFVGSLVPTLSTPDLAETTLALAETMLRTYYPHERPSAELEPRVLDIDGRAACQVVVPMEVDDVNLDFTTETAVFVLVDVGAPTPGALVASLPEGEHVPSDEDVLAQLRVAPE